MRYIFSLLFFMAASILPAQDCSHARDRTQNTLVPDIKFTLIPRSITETSAVAFLGEAGRRNYRFNGTLGIILNCEKRFKVSGEYLQQKLGYNYSTGKAKRWVRQYAIGAAYEHDFCCKYISSGEISAYCSYAPTRHLSSQICNNFRYDRRIAGSTAYGGEIGSTLSLWQYAFLFLDANYDAVIYRRKYHKNKHVEGFGASIGFHQQLFTDFGLDLRAEFRRPFNYYRVSINWTCPQMDGFSVGIFGSHTRGKSNLPSNTVAGIELNAIIGRKVSSTCNDCSCRETFCAPELSCWVSRPAVYLPEVFAISEERAISLCRVPSSTGIPDVILSVPGPYSFSIAPFFQSPPGFPLTFSAENLPPDSAIDPSSGVISGIAFDDILPTIITITASNSCGMNSQSFLFAVNVCDLPIGTSLPNVFLTTSGPFAINVSTFFTSPDGTPLTFTADGLPSGASIDPITGIISGVATCCLPPFAITVFATNECGSASESFTLTYCNTPPIGSAIPNQTLIVTGPFTINVSPFFTSPDASPIVFTADGLPPGAAIDPNTGIISGTATAGGSPFVITVFATNDCGTTFEQFTLSYCTNLPTSSAIPPFATCITGAFSYPVGSFFTNPPGSNPFVFSATGLPAFATINSSTGTITGVNPSDTSVYNVTVTANNGCGSTSQPLTMTFTCPAPTSSPIPNQNIPLLSGDPYTLNVVSGNFTSPCGQAFTFTATGLPPGSTINSTTGVISGVAVLTNSFTVTIFGTTSCGQTSQTFQLDFSSS